MAPSQALAYQTTARYTPCSALARLIERARRHSRRARALA